MTLPETDTLRWLVRTYAGIRERHGHVLGTTELIEPSGKFFPDAFQLDAPSIGRLLRRMMSYAPLSEKLPVELAVLPPDEEAGGGCGSGGCGTGSCATTEKKAAGSGGCGSGGCGSGGCGSGGCGSGKCGSHSDDHDHAEDHDHPPARADKMRASGDVEPLAAGYRLYLKANDTAHPDLLAAALSRGVGALVMHEGGDRIDANARAAAEVTAVACGFGVLLTNGAEIWKKGCGGAKQLRSTLLSVHETALLLTLEMAVHNIPRATARKHFLAVTQREAFDLAEQWTLSNPELVRLLRDNPAFVAADLFTLEPSRGALGRFFHRQKAQGGDMALSAPVKSKPPMSEEKRRRIEETRALVEDVLERG